VIAVCETVGIFNTGAASKAVLMKSCGISPGSSMLEAFRKEDKKRIQGAAYKVTLKYREKRRALRAQKKDKTDKQSYSSGAFGLSTKPEEGKLKRKRKEKENEKELIVSTSNQVEVTFVMPVVEVVAPKKVKRD
jgi:hypothetical protein